MTLYEGLYEFQDLYLTRLEDSSRRVTDPIATDWQKICNEYDLYLQASGQGEYTTAETHLDNIVAILNGYNIIVDEPVQPPLSLSVYSSPSVIDVPVDSFGQNPDYSNASCYVYVYVGGINDSANWSYTITAETNLTANISDHNKLNITDLTADSGLVELEMSKTNYGTLSFVMIVNRRYDAEKGLSINLYPDTIVIPCDSVGTPLSYAQAYSDVVIREGNTDETSNWGLSITGTTDVTANISGGNRVNITNIAADEGSVEVTCTRTGYPAHIVDVYVQKQLQGQAVVDGSSVDDVTIGLNVSSELEVKDDGITTPKIDASSVYGQKGSMIKYFVTGFNADAVIVPTIVRRPLSSGDYSTESGHSIGSGTNNVVIGPENRIGPANGETEYTVQSYNTNFDRVFLASSEGDVSADFVAGDELLIWNVDTDTSDNYRYYIQGEITASAFTGSNTTVDITPSFNVDTEISNYVSTVYSSTNTMRCAHYVEQVPDFVLPRDKNIIYGVGNSVNGSINLVIGGGWRVHQGTPGLLQSRNGNVLIGGGAQGTVLGNNNLFLIHNRGNNFTLTFHEDSHYNLAIGGFHQIGDNSDTSGRSINVSLGLDNTLKSSGSIVLGNHIISNSNGEIILATGDYKRRKVMLQMTARTSGTLTTPLQMFGDPGLIASVYTTPSNFNVVEDSLYSFTVDLIGIQSDGDVYRRKVSGCIKNIAGTTTMVGSINEDADYSINEFAITGYAILADDIEDQLNIEVTPSESTTTTWLAWVEGEIVEI